MAQLYTIKCPHCKHVFKVPKGVFVNWDFSKPIPLELREETPFYCPNCNYKMSVNDKDFRKHVVTMLYVD